MNTPDDMLPAELNLVSAGPADISSAPTPSVPTPGVSSGVTRVATSPTLPDPEPTSLSLLIQRMANELFVVPAVPTGDSLATMPSQSPTSASPAPPALAAPAEPAVPSADVSPLNLAEQSAGDNPFASEPSFDSFLTNSDVDGLDAFRLSLFEEPAPDEALPLAPSPLPHAAILPATTGYELDPTTGIDLSSGGVGFDAHVLKKEFPILQEPVHGKQLVWLDNAATTQKPQAVIDRLSYFYEHENSNIHRAAHALAARATDAYEDARESVRRFLNAPSTENIVFVRGTTEGINLVSQSWGQRHIEPGDEIIVSHLEHHANIVPWQLLCKEKGAILRVIPVDDTGQILLDEYERLFTSKTKLVSVTQVSNALGTVTPAREMVDIAHRHGALVLLDAAQSVSHMRVDFQALDCDFLVFSGHKVFGPTGIGAVVAKREVLESMPPWQGGGNMIQDVTFERTIFQPPPARFEAGTGNIADAVGLGAALDWLTKVGIENVSRHEHELLVYGTQRLLEIPGLKIIGTSREKAGVLSFIIDGHSTEDVSRYLDSEGIAVRGGHHCAQPILRRFGLETTVRASLAPYNTFEDLDALVDALCRLVVQ